MSDQVGATRPAATVRFEGAECSDRLAPAVSDLPRVVRVRQRPRGPVVADVAGEVTSGLAALDLGSRVRPGDSVALTGGSRGLTDGVVALRAVADHLRTLRAEPFLVPAMGSHGGGTAEGQEAVLAGYGMTEAALGCPVRASMDVVEVGRSALGFPLWQDRLAAEADHVVVLNRVKPHTMFTGRHESGLVKMLLLGLGKQDGAAILHRAAVDHGWEAVVAEAAPRVLAATRVLCGVALVERSDERTARVAVLAPDRWMDDEPDLLDDARRWMPRLPFDDIDLLLLDRIGKDISGTGLDVNVVGRKAVAHPLASDGPGGVRLIAVRGLTPETRGNAAGIGLAELARSRVLRQMDVAATRLNALTAGRVAGAMIPLDHETDRELLATAQGMTGLRPPSALRLVWARSTLDLAETRCSAALVAEAAPRDDLEVVGTPHDLPLDAAGNLPDDLPLGA
ncbi:MAG: lactate racemase domain-containing protein [Iamia sp.]